MSREAAGPGEVWGGHISRGHWGHWNYTDLTPLLDLINLTALLAIDFHFVSLTIISFYLTRSNITGSPDRRSRRFPPGTGNTTDSCARGSCTSCGDPRFILILIGYFLCHFLTVICLMLTIGCGYVCVFQTNATVWSAVGVGRIMFHIITRSNVRVYGTIVLDLHGSVTELWRSFGRWRLLSL